ncbi:MAG: ABC transporter ATP-binding protein/permease [Eubacterium sp.]|nr:ABC transporter ATP-binding protein/permease [Eubacterium sp.]
MFGKDFQRKYALTDQGVKNTKLATFWTVVVNFVVMGGMGILYLMMSKYMDTLTTGAALPGAGLFLLLVLAFVVLSFFTHLQQYSATYGLVYGEVKSVRISLAERMRKLPLGYFGKRDLADLTETIMGDVNRLEHVWSHCLGYLYGSYISTAVIAVMLFYYDWRLAIACLWGVPVAFILLFGSRKINKRNSEITKEAGIQVSDGIQETLENIREIRATNQETKFLKELNDKIDDHEKTMLSGELSCGIFVNAASVIMRLGVATTILTGTKLILSGEVEFMVLFMFLLVITRIYAPFDQALALIAEMLMSQISASRLMEIHDTATAEGAGVFKPEGHDIEFENVGFAYGENSVGAGRKGGIGRDHEQVLKGVSFTAKAGEVTALVGPSGSGKSTCARLAARLWDAPEGKIKVGGVDISSVDPEVLLSDYSMVFQDVVLFDDTVMENIRLGKHGATDEEVKAAARAANCDEFVEKLPQGYNTQIGENGAKLSGGERQRISIARALLKNAPIVLLDEATASLDVENETRVQEALSRLLEGKTVLVIAHRMRTVEAADKIVVLADGKVAEQGSPSELLKKEDGIFKRMAKLQSESAEWSIA